MHPRISVNGVCSRKSSLAEDIRAWRELGVHTVGQHAQKIDAAGWDQGVAALKATGLKIESLVHPSEFRLDDAQGWEAMRADFRKTLDAAKFLGARSVYTTSGHRGRLTWEDAARQLGDAMAPLNDHARENGLHLLVEPTVALHADKSIVHSLRDALRLSEITGLGICLDLFHCWTEAGLKETIAAAAPHVHLVQVGDYVMGDKTLPCRAVIGDGDIPIERILGWIVESGYQGAFDVEVNGPRIDGEGLIPAVRRSVAQLEQMLANLGVR